MPSSLLQRLALAALIATVLPARAADTASCDLLAAPPRMVAEGFKYTEGPNWSPQGE